MFREAVGQVNPYALEVGEDIGLSNIIQSAKGFDGVPAVLKKNLPHILLNTIQEKGNIFYYLKRQHIYTFFIKHQYYFIIVYVDTLPRPTSIPISPKPENIDIR